MRGDEITVIRLLVHSDWCKAALQVYYYYYYYNEGIVVVTGLILEIYTLSTRVTWGEKLNGRPWGANLSLMSMTQDLGR